MEVKLSVIIPNYNNERFLKKCLDSLLSQTYKNLEIIVVNDGSKGDCDSLIVKYQAKSDKIKYVKHKSNKGLFQARLTGADIATGDYIAFLDADDYVSSDFYRPLLNDAVKNNSDMVIGNSMLEYDDGLQIEYNLAKFYFNELKGEECLDNYFAQEGLNFFWHTVWNKIYSIEIWKQARKHYSKMAKRLIMTEDFSFSTVLFYYAKKITVVDNDCIFYCQHDSSATSVAELEYKKALSNINDLITSFDFVENFLKEVNLYNKYKKNFNNWKNLYALIHSDCIKNSKKISVKEKEELSKLMQTYCKKIKPVAEKDYYTSVCSSWNKRLEEIKETLNNSEVEVVSFDIFNTLILMPFFQPSDLYKFLDKEYRKLNEYGVDFSSMRENAEKEAIKALSKINGTLTLDYIYSTIEKGYGIDRKILESLKKKEIELVTRFCTRRKTAYDLYELALYLGKRVVFTSDTYLPENIMKQILTKCGYINYEKLFISSKNEKNIDFYNSVLEDLNVLPNNIVHIGSDYKIDCLLPSKLKIKSFCFDKPLDVFFNKQRTQNLSQMFGASLPFWYDNKEADKFLGIRTMLAMVANTYFDNPYRPFNEYTDFNADPYLIGYYAMGMYIYGVGNWLIKNTACVNDTISFMARDGYLAMEAYKILKKAYIYIYKQGLPEERYLYTSRKALLPIVICDSKDLYKLTEFVDIYKQSPKSLVSYLKDVIVIDEKVLKALCESKNISFGKTFKNISQFNEFIRILIDNFFDKDYLFKKREMLATYFKKNLGERPAVFDVGYSARPEFYLSKLINKKISTYFLNINSDIALNYSSLANFDLHTYFAAKPTITGYAYELLLSKQDGSCISYNFDEKGNVEPVLEKYNESEPTKFAINLIQKSALEFVSDMVTTFGDYLDILYYQDYYISLPFLAYLNSSSYTDKVPLSTIIFEDDLNMGSNLKMIDAMQSQSYAKNQQLMHGLIYHESSYRGLQKVGNLVYNPYVDLNNAGKIKRILYYSIFDRETFKRRIKEKIKRKK